MAFVLVLEPLIFAQEARPDAVADVLYLEANGHFNRGQYAQAIERYNAFLLKFPDHTKRVNVRYGLGLSLFQLKKYREAEESLKIVAVDKRCPDVPRANYFLGQALMATGKYAEADKALGRGIKALSDVLTGQENKAIFQELEQSLKVSKLGALVHLRNWEDVVKESAALKGKAGIHACRVSFQGALARYELKQFKEVLPLLLALKKDAKDTPYEQQSYFLLAEALRELGKESEALAEYEAAAKIRGSFQGQALYRLGTILHHQGNPKEAIVFLSKLCEEFVEKIRSEQYQQAQIYLGMSYVELENLDAAQKLLSKIWTSDTHLYKVEAGYHLAGITTKDGQLVLEAAKIFGEVSDRYPKHELAADARLKQGTILSTFGKYGEAQTAFEQFAVAYPDHKEMDNAAYQLGLCLMERNHWDQALKSYAKIPKNSEWRDEALYQSAWCAKRMERKPVAIGHYKEVLEEHKKSPLIAYTTIELAELEFETGEFDAAINRLERLVSSNAEAELKVRAQHRLGWCYFEKKEFTKAAGMYELALPRVVKGLWVNTVWQAGESRLRSGEYGMASSHFLAITKTQKLTDKNLLQLQEQAWLRLGYSQALDKKWEDSGRTYTLFINNYHKHPHQRLAYAGLGIALKEQKLYREAITVFHKIIKNAERDELGAKAQYWLAECFLDQKEYDLAITEYAKVELYPFEEWQAKAVYESAVALERKGDGMKANEQFKKLILKYPHTEAAKIAAKREK